MGARVCLIRVALGQSVRDKGKAVKPRNNRARLSDTTIARATIRGLDSVQETVRQIISTTMIEKAEG
jgi:hypothetical protein